MADAPQNSHPQTDVAASDIVSSGGFGSFGRCCKEVRIPRMNFPRYRQCTRKAVTVEACGPVCKQHTTDADESRKQKTILADERRRKQYFAYLRAKQAKPNHIISDSHENLRKS